MYTIASNGCSGGLVMAWRSDRVRISVLSSNKHFIHARCDFEGFPSFLLTAVYVIPHSNLRQALWNDLKVLSTDISEPWVVYGDFNDIADASERVGGRIASQNRIKWFNDRIIDCCLNDLNFKGPKFTWKGRKMAGCARMFERLDRALGNAQFMDSFNNYLVKVCSQTAFSDHNPLSLFLDAASMAFRGIKPFRFEAMWIEHGNFLEEVFGLVEKKKRNILNRLKGIQQSQAYPFSSFLSKLELELQAELEFILKLEEVKWFQKARSNWITKRDRNTRYYHLKTHRRRKWNRIVSLKNDQGVWIHDNADLKSLVVSYFKKLYSVDDIGNSNVQTVINFPRVEKELLDSMGFMPNDKEIKDAIFDMGPYKAPGFDGFSPIFFQYNWETVGPFVCKFVKGVFQGNLRLDDSNKTLISLIPKRENPEVITHFRQISLCSVHYKCITKIIANRLKVVMDDLVSPYQASFIKRRHIQDNIIIGQELLHVMSKAKGKTSLWL
ncbi:uncharacterized protein LOC114755464 [Neltuma alba]|uniref:uncharacterized protein LOC114755464 n=1 Tax=Neltuma alba TaxID=207710 RepID=UPI0010A305C8|nr:uncharacterized protein LOC114755464 [Prosopis alba]